mmetsp:Transcript_8408/g.25250  ORF Transcript_8408/g.25250 Transcript_8408/m.25250 type:complete len:135 (+) Transcript_8408:1051-1455(+)
MTLRRNSEDGPSPGDGASVTDPTSQLAPVTEMVPHIAATAGGLQMVPLLVAIFSAFCAAWLALATATATNSDDVVVVFLPEDESQHSGGENVVLVDGETQDIAQLLADPAEAWLLGISTPDAERVNIPMRSHYC